MLDYYHFFFLNNHCLFCESHRFGNLTEAVPMIKIILLSERFCLCLNQGLKPNLENPFLEPETKK